MVSCRTYSLLQDGGGCDGREACTTRPVVIARDYAIRRVARLHYQDLGVELGL